MKVNRTSHATPRPTLKVEKSKGIEEVAAWRDLPVDLLTEFGVHVDDHPTHPIVIPYPNLIDVWYERRRAWVGDDRANKYLSPKGASPHLYNPLHLGPNAAQVWFCEGEFDTLTLISYGLPAIGVAGTNAFNIKWAHLYSSAEVVIAYDGDAAGVEAAEKLRLLFGRYRTRTFRFPTEEGSDLNDMHKAGTLGDSILAFAEGEGVYLPTPEGEDEAEQSEEGGEK